MSVVANVAINVDASKALQQINSLNTAANALAKNFNDLGQKIGSGLQGVGGQIKNLGSAMTSLGGVIAGIGAGALVKGFGEAGIAADRTGKTIKALAGSYGEVNGVQAIAANAAKEFGIGQTTASKAVADLYGRLRPMGVSLEEIGTTFNGVNKAAALMNLTTADTEGVMLQLSQSMGSGRLQGDELRSVMERLPAVGQAIAKVMGVSAAEIKQLGADGMITTDILVKAMAELNKIEAPPPDAFKLIGAAMEDLATSIGTQLLPLMVPLAEKLREVAKKFEELKVGQTLAEALTPLAGALLGLVDGFLQLDPGMQKAIIQFAAIGTALALIIVPAGIVIGAIGSIVSALGGLVAFLTGGALGTALAGVVALLTGPVGIAIAIGALIALIWNFRDEILNFFVWLGIEIGKALQTIFSIDQAVLDWFAGLWDAIIKTAQTYIDTLGDVWQGISDFFNKYAIQPVKRGWNSLVQWLSNAAGNAGKALNNAWDTVAQAFDDYVIKPIQKAWGNVTGFFTNAMSDASKAVGRVWEGMIGNIKNVIRSVMQFIANGLNAVGREINKVIDAYNRLPPPTPDIPRVPIVNVPKFAEGGYVNRPTFAMIGEGGEGEYIIPESKMAAAAANYLSGRQGRGIIPSNGNSTNGFAMPQINIKTGPVLEFNGEQYVTLPELHRAMRETARGVMRGMRTPSTRISIGLT